MMNELPMILAASVDFTTGPAGLSKSFPEKSRGRANLLGFQALRLSTPARSDQDAH